MPDAEIDAMSAVAAALDGLDDAQRGRVLRWAADRFEVAIKSNGSPTPTEVGADEDVSEQEIAAEAPTFEHFAELFAAAQPTNDADKALVAGYWLQAIKGHDKWKSADAQKELKNMGHALSHIAQALTANINKRPQRVIQLQKAGSTQQARKTYKVTHEGLVYVQGMLGHGG
jgi:hypothetical protein